MSLRLRLFLLFGGLVALLVVAQWWWARVLTRDLSSEIDQVASSVGHSVATYFADIDLSEGVAGAHGAVIECLGGDCEEVTLLEEDIDVMHHAGAAHAGAGGESAGEAGTAHESKVVIQKFQRQLQDADSPGVVAYSYRTREHHTGDPEGAETRVERHVKLHVEHEDGARYLWLAGPRVERRFQIPQSGIRDKLDRFSRRLVLGSVGFLALGLVLAGVVAHRETTPLRRLSEAARRLGEGALGTRVPLETGGEVGEAVAAFNRMSGRLEQLDERNRELSARKHLGEIGDIARGLAHTLRNPLNALGLSVEELAAGGGGDAPDLIAESARRQIRRIDSSLKSFLALASQSGGVLAEVDLGELAEDVGLEALQDGRGKVHLEVEPAPELPRLRAVEPELRAVVQALVVNAIEASPEGGEVTVRAASPSLGRWRLEVDDQGPGLPAEVRRRLFTPHLSTKANGSGMGLFLAHRIATNRYAGSLELLDRETGGTRAVLEIGERAEQDPGARPSLRGRSPGQVGLGQEAPPQAEVSGADHG